MAGRILHGLALASLALARQKSYARSKRKQNLKTGAPADRMEMSRALEQLRELGALRDAGYVTEKEFEQLKKKILDGAL